MARVTQYSAVHLIPEAGVDSDRWNTIPSEEVISEVAAAAEKRGIRVIIVDDAGQALETIRKIIPPGAEVMNGSSTTLIEIGYEDLLESKNHKWKDLHLLITSTDDDKMRADLRRKSVTAEYFLSSANAVSQTGEIVACDRSGSRTGAWPFAAEHLILVVGINKIVPSLNSALERVRSYAYPLENVRAKLAYGTPSSIGKCVILSNEAVPGRIILILVRDRLGY